MMLNNVANTLQLYYIYATKLNEDEISRYYYIPELQIDHRTCFHIPLFIRRLYRLRSIQIQIIGKYTPTL